jgi:hypothetical protein
MKGGDDAWFDVAADDKLKEVETDEYDESGVERFELRGCEPGWAAGWQRRMATKEPIKGTKLRMKAITPHSR